MVNLVLAWHAEHGTEHGLVLHVVIDVPLFYFGTFVPRFGVRYEAPAERGVG